MWPLLVVSPEPRSADLADLVQIFEHIGIEHFVSKRAVVALDVRILIGLAGLNVTRLDAVALAPVEQLLGDELGVIVHA